MKRAFAIVIVIVADLRRPGYDPEGDHRESPPYPSLLEGTQQVFPRAGKVAFLPFATIAELQATLRQAIETLEEQFKLAKSWLMRRRRSSVTKAKNPNDGRGERNGMDINTYCKSYWPALKKAAETAIRLEPDPDKKADMEDELADLAVDVGVTSWQPATTSLSPSLSSRGLSKKPIRTWRNRKAAGDL